MPRSDAPRKWDKQVEALEFALSRDASMMAMDMGTGKTRVAIEAVLARDDVHRVLVVSTPKAYKSVWPREFRKYAEDDEYNLLVKNLVNGGEREESTDKFGSRLYDFLSTDPNEKKIALINYQSVWRGRLGEYLIKQAGFDMVVLDESHKIKSAGSKISKYMARMGKSVPVRMCLTGTPMAESPLDVYGQFRFLDRRVFGTNHAEFLAHYAVMGGPDGKFPIGVKNQRDMMSRIAPYEFRCALDDIKDSAGLPEPLPVEVVPVSIPDSDMVFLHKLKKDFVAGIGGGVVDVGTILTYMTRARQITSGFCMIRDSPLSPPVMKTVNTAKEETLYEILESIDSVERVVVFAVFKYDLESIARAAQSAGRPHFEISGREDQKDEWDLVSGAVLAVQIESGAEGIDLTSSKHVVYYSLPVSLSQYEQSRFRLYRPGQTRQVHTVHIVAEDTEDENISESLRNKKSIIDMVRDGEMDYGRWKK